MTSNPSRHNLSEKDLLYFWHIPKCAGSLLISILDKKFEPKKVLNLHEWQELLPIMPVDFTKYNFIRGHFGRGVLRLTQKKPLCITMLRDPIKLMISSYKMVIRQETERELYSVKKNETLSSLITDPKRYPLTNRQAHHIVADLDIPKMTNGMSKEELKKFFPHHTKEFYLLNMPDEELLEKAKSSLINDFIFFGIVEKMQESLFLLSYTFGWYPIRDVSRENVAPKDQDSKLTKQAQDKLFEMTRVDQKLYDFALEIFDSRYSQMVKDLQQKYHQEKFEKMSPKDAIFEMLVLNYKKKNQ